MPTWGEIKEHARSKYTLKSDEEEFFTLVWEYPDGRSQQIYVRHFPSYEREWVEFRSYVCNESELSPRVALRKNETLPIGALALDKDGDYFIIYSVQLATLDLEEFDLPLSAVARAADVLELQHTAKDDY
jgi:hypothetical protein